MDLSELAVPQKKIKILEPLLVMIVALVAIIYVLNFINTGDYLWFYSRPVDAHPDRIIVMDHGERQMIQAGHDDFLALSEAAHVSLSEFSNTNLINLDFGERTMEFYENEGLLIEFYYDSPINYHAKFRVGNPTQLMVPIDGRHAGHDYFVRGDDGQWWFGAMRMTNPDALYSTLEELGYLENVE